MTKTYLIISLNGFLYSVEEGMSNNGKPKYWVSPENGQGYIVSDSRYGQNVVASNDSSLTGVPKLPEITTNTIYPEDWLTYWQYKKPLKDIKEYGELKFEELTDRDKYNLGSFKLGVLRGIKEAEERLIPYIQAASKKQYTEEDMLNVMNLGMTLRQDQLNGNTTKSGNEILADYVKSLKSIPKEVELEMEANIPPRYNHVPQKDDFLIHPKVENGFVIIKSWKYE